MQNKKHRHVAVKRVIQGAIGPDIYWAVESCQAPCTAQRAIELRITLGQPLQILRVDGPWEEFAE